MANSQLLAAPAIWRPASTESDVTWWEKGLAFAGFVLILGTFKAWLLTGGQGRTEGSALFQLLSGGVYLSAIAAVLVRGIPAWTGKLLLYALPLVILTLLPLVSTLWSQAPTVTFRRAAALCLCFGFAMFLVIRFDLRTLFNILVVSFVLFVVVGTLAAGIPRVGITPGGEAYPGSWRGLAGQKNVFARTLALCLALIPVALAWRLTDRRRAVFFASGLGFVLLILSESATSLVAAMAGVSLGGMLYFALGGSVRGLRLQPEIGITFLVIVAIALALTITYGWTDILEALGRDPTLTGRTKLWEWTMHVNESRQWLGSGYRAFWIDANTKYFFEFFAWAQDAEGRLSDSFSGPDHAHSGYMDTYLELGILGATAYGITIISALIHVRRALVYGNYAIGFIFAVILSFLLVYAVTEKSVLQQSEDLWFLFTTLYLFTVKETLLSRQMR